MNDFMNKINLLIGKHEAEKFELKKQVRVKLSYSQRRVLIGED